MFRKSSRNNAIGLPFLLLPILLLGSFFSRFAAGQNTTSNPITMQTAGLAGGAMDLSSHGVGSSVFVSVREPNGLPVMQNATVRLSCPLANVNASGPTNESAQTEFTNVPPGDCFVEVSAPGYRTSRERTVVAQSITTFHQYIYVYLHSASEVAVNNSRVPLSLDVLKEMDKGTEALHNNRADDARKHWLKAAERAPENPDVQYLLGTLESSQNNIVAAKSRFERAIALSPTHEQSLLALGELQLRNNQSTEATATLKRALQVNTMSYRAEFYLAQAYLQQRDYAMARAHAQRAVELGGNKQPMAHVLLGQALAADGDRNAARHEFEALIHDFPNDPTAAVAKEDLASLERPATAIAVHITLPFRRGRKTGPHRTSSGGELGSC